MCTPDTQSRPFTIPCWQNWPYGTRTGLPPCDACNEPWPKRALRVSTTPLHCTSNCWLILLSRKGTFTPATLSNGWLNEQPQKPKPWHPSYQSNKLYSCLQAYI